MRTNWSMNANRYYLDIYDKIDGSGASIEQAALHVEEELVTKNLRCEMYTRLPEEVWFHLKPLAWLCISRESLQLHRTSVRFIPKDRGDFPPAHVTTIKAIRWSTPLESDGSLRVFKSVTHSLPQVPQKGGKKRR